MLSLVAVGLGLAAWACTGEPSASPADLGSEPPPGPGGAADGGVPDSSRLEAGPPGLAVAFPALTFESPVDLTHAGDGTDRLFVVEQPGRILVLSSSAATATATVFLDIRGVVNAQGWEEGLLGLAFHPKYETNGYLFVNYTANPPRRTVVARYRASASDPNKADPQSESVLLEIDQPYENHNGGQLAFGPDGYLYIAVGDGGGGGDPHGNGQNLTTLLGSMLRIDVDVAGDAKYAIPPDNPFVGGTAGERPEIWAYGLRNPWRFSFDPVTQELWTGDVGQDKWEEIDIIAKGKNYGWNIMEGTHCHSPPEACSQAGLELPLHAYGQSGGQSVTGGYVYRGQRLPQLQGAYIFADFIGGRIWRLDRDAQGQATVSLLAESQLQISSFGIDRDGELYLCAFDGRIYRLE